jgi:hypothetical protein
MRISETAQETKKDGACICEGCETRTENLSVHLEERVLEKPRRRWEISIKMWMAVCGLSEDGVHFLALVNAVMNFQVHKNS